MTADGEIAANEAEGVDTLRAFGVELDDATIIAALHKCDFHIEKTYNYLNAPPSADPVSVNYPASNVPSTSGSTGTAGALNSRSSGSVVPPPTPRLAAGYLPYDVMDLTGDDNTTNEYDELQKALSLSLGEAAKDSEAKENEPSQQLPVYGPAPPGEDPNKWALVPINQDQGWNSNTNKQSVEDLELARAMEASMAQAYPGANQRPTPIARGDNNRKFIPDVPISDWAQPVAILDENLASAQVPAVLLQAIFAVPQIKQAFKGVRLGQGYEADETFNRFAKLQEYFTALDHSQRGWINLSYIAPTLNLNRPQQNVDPESDTGLLLDSFLDLFNAVLAKLRDGFESTAELALEQGWNLPDTSLEHPNSIVQFPIQISPATSMSFSPFSLNDLHRALQLTLAARQERAETLNSELEKFANVFVEPPIDGPADENDPTVHPSLEQPKITVKAKDGFVPEDTQVLFVKLRRDGVVSDAESELGAAFALATEPDLLVSGIATSTLKRGQSTDRTPFRFPLVLNTERWTEEKAEENSQRLDLSARNQENVEVNARKLAILVGSKDKPQNLTSLKTALNYVENIASADTPERKEAHANAAKKLNLLINHLKGEIESTVNSIREGIEIAHQLDALESGDARHQFHLRAVLIHDGQYGGHNLYSYTKSPTGEWWKTAYNKVTLVTEETVLSDRAGLYLNSGPYLLIYSREPKVDAPTSTVPQIVTTRTWPLPALKVIAVDNHELRTELEELANQNAAPPDDDFYPTRRLEELDPLRASVRLYFPDGVDETQPVVSTTSTISQPVPRPEPLHTGGLQYASPSPPSPIDSNGLPSPVVSPVVSSDSEFEHIQDTK